MRKKRNRKSNSIGKKKRITPLGIGKIFFVFLVTGALLFFSFKLFSSSLFKIENIEANIDIDKDIKKEIKGKSIFHVDTEMIRGKLLRRHRGIKEVYVRKVFPSFIKIYAEKRIPFAQIKKDGFYLLDKERVLLKRRLKSPYPDAFIIEIDDYDSSLEEGRIVKDKRIELAYSLIDELNKSGLLEKYKISTINATLPYSISFFIDNVNIIMGEGDFKRKLFLLKRLLENRYNNKVDSLRYIDLRYATSDDNIYVGNRW